MSKRRALVLIPAGLVLLVVLVVAGLVLFFPTERATVFAVQKLESATGREVEIGKSSVRIVPSIRLVLEDVAFGAEAAPGAPRITVASLALGVKLMPLLGRRVEITNVTITDPAIEAVLAESEAPPAARPASQGTAAGGVELQVDELVMTGGRVSVRTADGQPFVDISGLEEHLTAHASAAGDVELQGTTRAAEVVLHLTAGEIGRGLPLALEKSLRYDAGGDRLVITQAALDVAGVPVALTGEIGEVKAGEMNASLVLDGGPGQIDQLLGLLPAGLFPEMEGMKSSGTLALTARLSGPLRDPQGPDFDARLMLTDGRIQYPGVARAVEGIALELVATPDTVTVTEFTARSASSSLRAHATIADYRTTPRVRLALDTDVDLGDVAFFYPAAESLRLDGSLSAQLIAEGPSDDPDAFTIDGTVKTRGMSVQGPAMRLPVEGLTATAVFDKGAVTVQSATGHIGSSDFALSGRLENPMALDTTRTDLGRARGTFNLRCDRLNLEELMPPAEEAARGAGAPGAAARGAAATERRIPDLPPLDATVVASIGSLRVNGLDASNVGGHLSLDHDVLSMQDVKADVFEGRAALAGTMTITDPKAPVFDLTVDATDCNVADVFTYNRKLGKLATVAHHLSGTMSTKTTMKGALDDTLGLVVQSLASDGDVWVRDARLTDYPVQNALSTFLKSDQLQDLGIQEIVQSFAIRDGRLRFDDLNLRAGGIEAIGNGWSAIDGAYEMTLDLWLPRAIAEGVRDKLPAEVVPLFFAGNEQRLMVPVKVSGSRQGKPSVGLDAAKLTGDARARAAARLEAEKQRLADEAKARAEKEAAALLESAKPDSVPIQEAAKEKVEEKVKDALKGLFGKKK